MKQSIASDAVKLTASKIITLTISMINAVILSHFRTLEEYGTYSQLLMVINLASTIFMVGLPNSINFFLARAENDDEKQRFLSVYYTLTTVLGLITGLILVLSTSLIMKYFDNSLIKNFMYVFAIFPWVQIVLSSIDNIFIVYHKSSNLMLFRILNSILLLLTIIIVEIFHWNFKIYMLLFIIVESILAFSVYVIVRNLVGKIAVSFDKSLIKKILKFTVPLGLASVVGTLSVELDKLLIGRFFDTEELAIYANAAREMPVTIIASSLTAVLMPKLVYLLKKNKTEEAITLWGNATALSYIFICFIATGLFVYAPQVISLLYSDKYVPGVPVFRVYTIVLLLRCTYFGMILNSIGKTKLILYSSLASLGLNVVLNYLFYRIFGYIGPAIATFVSIAIVAFYQLVVTSKSINIPLWSMFPWYKLTAITLINIFMGLIFAIVKEFISLELYTSDIIESLILGFIWGIMYILIAFRYIKQYWTSLSKEKV